MSAHLGAPAGASSRSVHMLYYRPALRGDVDAAGDRLITGLLAPLLDEIGRCVPGRDVCWMRFAAQGSHLQLVVWCSEAEHHDRVRPLVHAMFADWKARHPRDFEGEMPQTELTRRLGPLIGGAGQPMRLRPPGACLSGLDAGAAGQEDGEHTPLGAALRALHSLQARALPVLLLACPGYAERLALGQTHFLNLLSHLGHNDADVVAYTTWVAATWTACFTLTEADLLAPPGHFSGKPRRYARLLSEFSRWPQGLRIVPPAARPAYAAMWQAIESEAGAGRLPPPAVRCSLEQVLAMTHQNFNRLGIGIFDEVHTMRVLGARAAARLADGGMAVEVTA